MGDLILAADAHLQGEDDHTEGFVAFLRQVGRQAESVVLAGDIFDLWIARPGLERPFHRTVLEAVDDLRRAGIPVTYIEGNRDYFVARRYGGGPFHRVVRDTLQVRHGGRDLHVAHGDRVNPEDRQYLAWRRLSRSLPVRALLGLLPEGPAARLSDRLERRFRTTNARFRLGFPEAHAVAYAQRAMAAGADTVVLGHFHQERSQEVQGPRGRTGRLFVLPGWREDRRFLRITPQGDARFEPFPG